MARATCASTAWSACGATCASTASAPAPTRSCSTSSDAPTGSRREHVEGYYEALNTGDAERVASFFCDDATHYYTRLGPHRGAAEIAGYAKLGVEQLDARWTLEHAVEGEDEVAIEWSMAWTDPRSGERRLDRGAEFLAFRGGLICEVRAYHHGGPKNPSGDLLGFDHGARGHSTL